MAHASRTSTAALTTGDVPARPGQPLGRRPSVAPIEPAIGTTIFALLLCYGIIEFARPQTLLGATPGWFRPALAISIVLMIYWVKRWGIKEIFSDPMLICILLFTAMSALWTPFAVNNYSAMQTTVSHGTALAAISIPLGRLLVPRERRKQYFGFWMLIMLYLSLFVLFNNGRGPGGILQDENDMAFALAMGLPYPYLLAQQRRLPPVRRTIYVALSLIIVLAIIATHSRGGFLGMACVVLYLIYLSRHRVRNLLVCAVFGLIALQFTPNSYFQRIGTITDLEDTSINERLTSWRIAWSMFLDNPVVGVGPRNFPWHVSRYQQLLPDGIRGGPGLGGRAAHSVYFTVLPEYGIVGMSIFGFLLVSMMRRLARCERQLEPLASAGDDGADADLLLARAQKASIIAFMTAGAFISVFYYPQLWYTIGFVVALSRDVTARYGPLPA